MVVYKSGNGVVYSNWCEGGPAGATYAASRSGWFDMTKFNQWFKEASVQLDVFSILVLALQEQLVPGTGTEPIVRYWYCTSNYGTIRHQQLFLFHEKLNSVTRLSCPTIWGLCPTWISKWSWETTSPPTCLLMSPHSVSSTISGDDSYHGSVGTPPPVQVPILYEPGTVPYLYCTFTVPSYHFTFIPGSASSPKIWRMSFSSSMCRFRAPEAALEGGTTGLEGWERCQQHQLSHPSGTGTGTATVHYASHSPPPTRSARRYSPVPFGYWYWGGGGWGGKVGGEGGGGRWGGEVPG